MRYGTIASLLVCLGTSARGASAPIEFNRDIRPILSDKCWTCHGPDAATKKIPLRLDSEKFAKADLGGRKPVVEGDPAASELIKRITTDSKAKRMPPIYTGHTLTQDEIQKLTDWIAQGAKWQAHWSFIPPQKAALPEGQGHAIDRFIRARLAKEGLPPAPEASKETLIRRLALDLNGVPPTPKEIDAFLNDKSANAYEKLVDRLLASPRFGERMAFGWLNAARYADTNGYQFDGPRDMWRWRDWVIDAFNSNKPYDKFALEQIAGDMLPGATVDQKIATGFNRNHRANTEDGIVPEEYAVEYVVDRVETTSTVFMGLTMGCTRCHNHKYDPITQKEFYRFFAYFNNVPENGRAMKYGNSPPMVPAPTREQQVELANLDAKIAKLDGFMKSNASAIAKAQTHWESTLAKSAEPKYWAPWAGAESSFKLDAEGEAKPMGNVKYAPGRMGNALQLDGTAYLDCDQAGAFDIDSRFSISAWVNGDVVLDGPIATRMGDQPRGRGYGLHFKQGKVHFHLTSVYADDAIRIDSEETVPAGEWHHVAITYTGSKMAQDIKVFVDGCPMKMKVEIETLYRPFRNAGAKFKEPFRIGGGWGKERRFKGLIDDVRVFNRTLNEEEISALALGNSVNAVAAKPDAQRSTAERTQLRWFYLDNAAADDVRAAWKQLTDLKLERDTMVRSFPTVMVMAESTVPKETHLLNRGQYNQPGEKVEPGLPAVLLPSGTDMPKDRLGFAQWLVNRSNPLTARVAVNRYWQMLFGTGLVKTIEDFGAQGEWPSQPELLDWLSVEFMDNGWNTKALLKEIVMSATYRQSSKASLDLIQRDPENRLLARGPRFRLTADLVRDNALAIAGLLNEKIGGPSVKPYQPDGLWKDLIMQDMDYVTGKGGDLYRRSLYTFWKRTIAPPMMANFDAANREACVVRENRTNTPLQALNLMNDVTFLEAARFLGQRMMKEGGRDTDARLTYGFRLATGRKPAASEAQVLRDNLQFHLDYFSGKQAEIEKYLSNGDSPSDPALDKRELAAYAAVGSLMLNLDEAMTKE